MFNKKLRKKVSSIESSLEYRSQEISQLRNDYRWLKGELDILTDSLGLVRQVTNNIRYVKKGGPERDTSTT